MPPRALHLLHQTEDTFRIHKNELKTIYERINQAQIGRFDFFFLYTVKPKFRLQTTASL